jgi:hypothetical protein
MLMSFFDHEGIVHYEVIAQAQTVTYSEWVQQSFVCNNVSAWFIKHVYHNIFRLKSKPSSGVIHVFNKARWNIVANEGLLYSFVVTCATGCTHPI